MVSGKRYIAGVFALSVGILAAQGANTSRAEEPADDAKQQTIVTSGTGEPWSFSKQELTDFKKAGVATGTSIPVEFTNDVERWLDETGDRSKYTASEAVKDGTARLHMYFTSAPSDAFIAKLETLPFDTDVIVGAALADQEVDTVSSLIGDVLARAGLEGNQFSAGLEQDAFSYYELNLASEMKISENQVALVQSELDAAIQKAIGRSINLKVGVSTSSAGINFQASVQGGRSFSFPYGSGTGECTTGFTAVRNGNQGVVTARHCESDNGNIFYRGESGVLTDGAAASGADIRFLRTLAGNTTSSMFHAGDSDDRVLQDFANAAKGTTIFGYGRTTGYRAGVVTKVNQCLSGVCGLDYVDTSDSTNSQSGDSGGPWFVAYSARGTHTGVLTTSSSTSLVTRIGRVANDLDATVKTS